MMSGFISKEYCYSVWCSSLPLQNLLPPRSAVFYLRILTRVGWEHQVNNVKMRPLVLVVEVIALLRFRWPPRILRMPACCFILPGSFCVCWTKRERWCGSQAAIWITGLNKLASVSTSFGASRFAIRIKGRGLSSDSDDETYDSEPNYLAQVLYGLPFDYCFPISKWKQRISKCAWWKQDIYIYLFFFSHAKFYWKLRMHAGQMQNT